MDLDSADGPGIAEQLGVAESSVPAVKLLMHRGPASAAVNFVEAGKPLTADEMISKLLGMVRAGAFIADAQGLYMKRAQAVGMSAL